MNRKYKPIVSIIVCLFVLINFSSCKNSRKSSVKSSVSTGSSLSSSTSVSDSYTNLIDYRNEYTQDYIDKNKNEVYKLQKNKGVTFITVQDIHIDSIDSKRYDQLRDIVLMTEQMHVDYVAVLGDLTSSLYDHDTAISMMKKVKQILDQCHCPVYYTRGDHEYNAENENSGTDEKDYKNIVTGKDWYNIFGKYDNFNVISDPENPYGGYFFVEMPALKLRAIFVNSFEFKANADGSPYINPDGSMGYWISKVGSPDQVKWITEKALDMTGKTDWTVAFYSHTIPYNDDLSTSDRTFHGYGSDNTPLRKIIQAFQNRSTWLGEYNSTVRDISVDYRWYRWQGKVTVAGWWSGHIHDDCFKRVDDLNMFVSTCTCANVRSSWANDKNLSHLPPDRNDTDKAMSVNMFFINQKDRKVNVIKFGSKSEQGMTNEFSF